MGPVAYKLELPLELGNVHDTFHVSNLKKCMADDPTVIPVKDVHIDEGLEFTEEPIEIIDKDSKQTRQSRVPLVRVRWSARHGYNDTWEREDFIKKKYPHLFDRQDS